MRDEMMLMQFSPLDKYIFGESSFPMRCYLSRGCKCHVMPLAKLDLKCKMNRERWLCFPLPMTRTREKK